MDIFNYTDYKKLINDLVISRPKEGHGQYKKMADYLGVSTVLISQIFKGHKDISLEQALLLADFFNFIELEKNFFLKLISHNRAGTQKLKLFYAKELETLRSEAKNISKRVKHQNVLTEEDKAIFYSDWKFSALRLACDLKEVTSTQELANLFNLDQDRAREIVEFLLKRGLIKNEAGNLMIGPASTHVEKQSPLVKQHHRNWRLKALEKMDDLADSEIMYTAPMCTSASVISNLNAKILKLIDEFVKEASEAPGEELYYFNIDLRNML
jgi:uncharacterized protein (TIGR02147 family)